MRTGRNLILSSAVFAFAAVYPIPAFCAETRSPDSLTAPPVKKTVAGALREKMKNVNTFQADFVQRKTLRAMDHTLVITGRVALEKSGRMAWISSSPVKYTCVIEGDVLTQWDADSDSVIKVDAGKNPALKMLFSTLRSYFSGDIDAMASGFDMKETEEKRVVMTPLRGSIAYGIISSVVFTASDDLTHVRRVDVNELNGDTTEIIFGNVRMNSAIPSGTWKVKK